MKLTPRGDEVKAVVELLESDEFDSAEKLAKAIIKTVASFLDMRDWYALTHTSESGAFGLNWGPYASANDALTVAKKVGLNGRWTALRLGSPGLLLGNVDGAPGVKGFCQNPECGHAPEIHLMHRNGKQRAACPLSTCPCEAFVK